MRAGSMEQGFSPWRKWGADNQPTEQMKCPGIYVVALSKEVKLAGKPFSFSKSIVYVDEGDRHYSNSFSLTGYTHPRLPCDERRVAYAIPSHLLSQYVALLCKCFYRSGPHRPDHRDCLTGGHLGTSQQKSCGNRAGAP